MPTCCIISFGNKKGDEVIVPTLSYISSANAILYVGARPIFCDSDIHTFNTNFELIKKISKKQKR